VQTAKLNSVNPESYLKDILTKIADGHPINRIGRMLQRTQYLGLSCSSLHVAGQTLTDILACSL
jgi:hypothetical protein